MMMMMMMAGYNNYSIPSTGYYNPPKPPVKPPAPITTNNYQEVIKYGDAVEYGGNGDGKVSAEELVSIKEVFNYAADYYKNMYQQSGDAKYLAWADHYARDAKATDNIKNNFSVFQQADSKVKDGVTTAGINNLASKDGQASDISLKDLAKQQFPNFIENDPLPRRGDEPRVATDGSPYVLQTPFPAAQSLTYLQPKADNPNVWDGQAFATGAVNRTAGVDKGKDGTISYAEALNSPDGLLGNGLLKLPPDSAQTRALWDALSGPDGTVNPQELAAAILSVDGNVDGTVTAAEVDKFLQNIMTKLAQSPTAAVSVYNNMQANASALGLDDFLQNTEEAAYARQYEQRLNQSTQAQTSEETFSLLEQANQAIRQAQGY
jgi:hypothetical protein